MKCSDQTLRRLRGRQPLCACGVTSLTPVTSSPAACSDRIAVSRPEPGPFTKTSTFWRPCSMPLRAAASAVTWAANGVDLREPLKPAPPADSQAMTFPDWSVRETIVLLNDVLMCAWPIGMFFLGRRRPRCGRLGAGLKLLLARLLLAGHLHPLRALAGARVGLGVLAADRQGAAVTDSAVAADLHQALDGLRALAPQIALDDVLGVDQVAQLGDLVIGQVAHGAVRLDAELGEHLVGGGATDAVDVRETDLDALVERDVDPGDSSHRALALPLLVPRVLADHEDPPVAADDLALLAHRLHRRSYLHDPFRLMIQTGWLWRPGRPPIPIPRTKKVVARVPRGPERDRTD